MDIYIREERFVHGRVASRSVRASAHERFFAAAVKQPQRPILSWLCSRTVKETQRSHILFTVSVCGMDFVGSVAVSAFLLRTRAKRRKWFWVHPLVSQRLLKGQFHKLYEDSRIHSKKFFGYFKMACSSFDQLSCMTGPKITYRNTVMRVSVPPEERLWP